MEKSMTELRSVHVPPLSDDGGGTSHGFVTPLLTPFRVGKIVIPSRCNYSKNNSKG